MLALPLVALATLVGFSRVCLGVHYPSDVLAGQTIAIVTDLVVFAAIR
jgi:undecaprenyl-diphosphatase